MSAKLVQLHYSCRCARGQGCHTDAVNSFLERIHNIDRISDGRRLPTAGGLAIGTLSVVVCRFTLLFGALSTNR